MGSITEEDSVSQLTVPTTPSRGRYGSSIGGRSRKLSAPPQFYLSPPWSLDAPLPHNGITPKSISRSGSPSRRMSTVSDVTRKISTTIGWRTIRMSEVMTQAKCLCSQYIRARLKRTGLMHKKAGLQRIQSVANLEGGWEVCEVFPRVLGIGLELERSHPKIYNSVARQLSVSLTSDKVVRSIIVAVANDIFKDEVSWARIISLLAVTAGLASDCVKQGHPEYVRTLVDTMEFVTERHAATWIIAQGGWSAILTWSQAPESEGSTLKILVLTVMGLIVMCLCITSILKYVTLHFT